MRHISLFMKRFTLLIFFIVSICGAFAQNISVKSFKALPMDLTASSLEGKRVDQNGDVAALIKVVTTETGFVFEGGTLGIVDTKQTPGEVWVWVPRAARKITIKHPKLGVLRDYYYPVEIEAERTYEMVLTTAKIETIVKEEVRMQYLAFQISPPNATLVVDEKYWDVEADGSAQDYVNFGTYSWRVEAPNYHSDAGRVTVDDPNNAKIVTVTLQPNFGWIEVAGTGNLKDASVYVDNVLIGRAPCKSEVLKSGKHTVRITKKMYATYTETVTVADNETTRLAPSLTADFAEVTLTVDADAEIYVNDERKGTRSWTGPLGSGTYKIECKQANHETSTTTKEITAAMEGQTITLPAPRPIYGSLNVESTPNFCNLYIDGKDMGTTPKSIAEILIGLHEIKLTKDGYADYTETVNITKGVRRHVKAVMDNRMKEVRFECGIYNRLTQLQIDGKNIGSVDGNYKLTYGKHSLKAFDIASDYEVYTDTIDVNDSLNTYIIRMQPTSEYYAYSGCAYYDDRAKGRLSGGGCYSLFRCNNYLTNYPDGKYVEQVKLRKAVLETEEKANSSFEFSIFFPDGDYELTTRAYMLKLRDIAYEARKLGCKLRLTGTGDIHDEYGIVNNTILAENRCRKIMIELVEMDFPEDQIIIEPITNVDPSLECYSRVLIQLQPKPREDQKVEDRQIQKESYSDYVLPVVSIKKDNYSEKIFTLNDVSFTMKLVEGGTFSMGCGCSKTHEENFWWDISLEECKKEAKPVHKVEVETFYMVETEVTQALWDVVMGSGNEGGTDCAIDRVSWKEIQTFLDKLNKITGRKFRLPTEAEWEYAARGGKNNSYNDDDCRFTGYVNRGIRVQKQGYPNELGLYDMMGNVLEWCGDWYGSKYYSNSPLANPQGPFSGLNRVIRGGERERLFEDFHDYAWSRLGGDPDFPYKDVGFRLCLSE